MELSTVMTFALWLLDFQITTAAAVKVWKRASKPFKHLLQAKPLLHLPSKAFQALRILNRIWTLSYL